MLYLRLMFMPVFCCLYLSSWGQVQPPECLDSIVAHNLQLRVLKSDIATQQLGLRTNNAWADLEIEVGVQPGRPTERGTKRVFSVQQSFDWELLSGYRRKVGKQQAQLLNLSYEEERLKVKKNAWLCWNDIVALNARICLLQKQQDNLTQLARLQERQWKAGETALPEYNMARLRVATLQGDLTRVINERTTRLQELALLNGGIPIAVNDSALTVLPLPPHFEEWYKMATLQHPILQTAQGEQQLAEQLRTTARWNALPSFSLGYASERLPSEHFRGITMGVSIPLWRAKRKIKQAQAAVETALLRKDMIHRELYQRMKTTYERTQHLRKTMQIYEEAMREHNSLSLLEKSLKSGNISLSTYLLELNLYYEVQEKMLSSTHAYQQAAIELYSLLP